MKEILALAYFDLGWKYIKTERNAKNCSQRSRTILIIHFHIALRSRNDT